MQIICAVFLKSVYYVWLANDRFHCHRTDICLLQMGDISR